MVNPNDEPLPDFDIRVTFNPTRGWYIITSPQFPELHHATNSGTLGLESALEDVPGSIALILRDRRRKFAE